MPTKSKTVKVEDVRKLAKQIARDLFTNGIKERALNLVLFSTFDKDSRRDLGGWSECAAADRIEATIRAAISRLAGKKARGK